MPKTKRDEERDAAALREFRRELGRRMDHRRADRGLERKQLYEDMGWEKTAYSRKWRGETTIMDDEIVALRRVLDGPYGWPFISAEEGLLLEALRHRAPEALRHIQEIHALLDGHQVKKR